MNRAIRFVMLWLAVLLAVISAPDATEALPPETTTQTLRAASCFQDAELSESIATLRLQGGEKLIKAYTFLLSKAKTAPSCRKEIVQGLINSMAQATDPTGNQYENFFLWESGADMLAELNAIEALDLLTANINLTDGWSTSISQSHTPALVAILKIGRPAIPKLQIVLHKDSEPAKRLFSAFAIAYIGGSHAKKALTRALPRETDPCVKRFLALSLQAFNNKAKPNHISRELNDRWFSALYCL